MLKRIDLSLVALLVVCSRAVVLGAGIGDALAIAALSALYGYGKYLNSKQEAPINEEIKKEVADLRSAVNALKLGRSIGRTS